MHNDRIERVRRAILTERALPDTSRVQGYFGTWPDFIREFADEYHHPASFDPDAKNKPIRPSPADIDDMLPALELARPLWRQGKEIERECFTAWALGISMQRVADRHKRSREWARQRLKAAKGLIR